MMSASASAQWRPGGPTRIVLLVDSSNAVSAMTTDLRSALTGFLDALPSEGETEPEITFITSGGQLRIRVPPTTDRTKVREAASAFFLDGGGNAFLETLLEADRRFLRSAPERRPIFVIVTTDTDNAISEARVAEYNRFVRDFVSRGGRAHAVVIRNANIGMTTRIAEHITQQTQGFYEIVGIANAVPKVMRTLAGYVAADL
jgi:hypothetical protein